MIILYSLRQPFTENVFCHEVKLYGVGGIAKNVICLDSVTQYLSLRVDFVDIKRKMKMI